MDVTRLDPRGLWLGRVERPGIGPCVVTLRSGEVLDITSKTAPTVRDVMELDDAAAFVRAASGERLDPSDGS
ncbi:MAG: fumarylacetoacetate hydrolase, partial [Planctomycetota bacterium]|nr:fumarylacetoacetate hydrolase [Planctomycetota bacterium]